MRALFLDRDGVINVRKMGGYIVSFSEFRFIEGVFEALRILSCKFQYIFIVTNQQGIGKGLMTDDDFQKLNALMLKDIVSNGGKITKVYYCPSLKEQNDPMRKPSIGMALKAKEEFPLINLEDSFMVGDSMSDMYFGKKAKMHNIFIDNKTEDDIDNSIIEKTYNSLIQFALDIK